jgi:hypothetical protein
MIELILAAALAQGAAEPHWRSIFQSEVGEAFVDPASVRRSGDTFQINVRSVFAEAQPSGMKTGISLNEYDCRRRTVALLHIIALDAGGVQTEDRSVTGPTSEHHPVPPGTPNDIILNEFCPQPGV